MNRTLIAVLLLTVFAKAMAQEPGKLAPLPDQLPPSVEARVGKVEFNKGLPTQKGIEQLFDIQDFQRATQLYQWAIPAIGVMGWHRASIANGKTDEFVWFRAYHPTKPFFDKSWQLPDITKAN